MIPPDSTGAVVLAIQNDRSDPPLLVGEWLEEQGIRLVVVKPFDGDEVPDSVPADIDGVLCMGGVMGANDDDVAPWLPRTRALLAAAVDTGVPVLGLCLGGQLLAAATGGLVTFGPATEIGIVTVHRTVDGLIDPVTSQVVPAAGSDIPATQWHHDNIVELPDGAVLLLTNEACPIQGFRVGDSAYGLQMHPEIDSGTFDTWAVAGEEELVRSGQSAGDASAGVLAAEADLVAAWRPMARAWGDLVWAHARNDSGTLAARA